MKRTNEHIVPISEIIHHLLNINSSVCGCAISISSHQSLCPPAMSGICFLLLCCHWGAVETWYHHLLLGELLNKHSSARGFSLLMLPKNVDISGTWPTLFPVSVYMVNLKGQSSFVVARCLCWRRHLQLCVRQLVRML